MNPTSEGRPGRLLALASLIIANLVPLVGVYLWGWNLTDLLLLYWIENAVVGLYTVMTMLAARPEGQALGARIATKLFTVPFFMVHYGIFWLVHGIFLVSFFGGNSLIASGQTAGFFLAPIAASWLRADVLAWPVAVMLVSHGVSFISNFLATGEYRNAGINELMTRPYGRVVVLHLTIVAGGFLVSSLGPSPAVLVLFVVVKIVADVLAQQREHRRVSAARDLRVEPIETMA